jgi:activator of HSP90 ATPase
MITRTITQKVRFGASPKDVYEMIMDSKKHQSLSGLKASISRKEGGKFSAWGKHIEGFNLSLVPGEKIVQAWRATAWIPHHYSIVTYEISRSGAGSLLRFSQIGVPAGRYSGHYRGWIETYWTPMKELLEKGKLSDKTMHRIQKDKERIATGHFKRKLSRKT